MSKAIVSEFDSHWVFHINSFVPTILCLVNNYELLEPRETIVVQCYNE